VIREAGLALTDAAGKGGLLGPVLLGSPAFPKAFARSYATAEESGTLDNDLARWSEYFQSEATRASGTLSTAVTSLLYGTVLLFVAWSIWGFYSSYFNALEQIGAE
jgi:type II secretory pathway component PulF